MKYIITYGQRIGRRRLVRSFNKKKTALIFMEDLEKEGYEYASLLKVREDRVLERIGGFYREPSNSSDKGPKRGLSRAKSGKSMQVN